MIRNRFDELSLTYILSRLMIEEPNYTVTALRGSLFNFVGLPSYTVRSHWWIMGLIRIILMINNLN